MMMSISVMLSSPLCHFQFCIKKCLLLVLTYGHATHLQLNISPNAHEIKVIHSLNSCLMRYTRKCRITFPIKINTSRSLEPVIDLTSPLLTMS
jgi:hypothetical protein